MLVRSTAAGARTYLTDALGSVMAQTDEDQTPINWYGYSPYGEVVVVGDDEQNPVQYTGRENDKTGLYYYRARYYDPVLKRFISEDPIGLAGGINYHSYVLGSPTNFTDPSGLKSLTSHATLSWNPYQNANAGRWPQSEMSSRYRRHQLDAWGGPLNPVLHNSLGNLNDKIPVAVWGEEGCINGVCTIKVKVCICLEDETFWCPRDSQEVKLPPDQDPACFCRDEVRITNGMN